MKLRTKITVISCLSMLVACVFAETIIWNINKRTQLYNTLMNGYDEIYKTYEMIDEKLIRLPEKDRKSYAVMCVILKTNADDYVICADRTGTDQETGKDLYYDIYNQTKISAGNLLDTNYKAYRDCFYKRLKYGDRQYYVYSWDFKSVEGRKLLYLYDITETNDRLYTIAYGMIIITLCVIAVCCYIISGIIKSAFSPIEKLNNAAGLIASGNYNERIEVGKRDELGVLAENFNVMAEAVEQRTRELETMEWKKTLLMGNLTHELKTPMTAIIGYVETLLMAKITPEEQEEALVYIHDECRRLERMSAKMVQLLGLEHQYSMEKKSCSIHALFTAVADTYEPVLSGKNITIEIKENDEYIYADMDLMTDVLINLLDNAIKASDENGSIYLAIGEDTEGKYISVRDTGAGIPKNELDKILEPFYMVDKSRNRRKGGAGLGLALVSEILKQHKFELVIDSEPGKGTDVRIYNMFTKC